MSPPQVALTQLAPTVIGTMWMETVLAAVFVWTRLYVRFFISQAGLGWDDAFMVVSWFLFVAYTSSCTAATQWGFGRHMDELSIPQFSKANLLENVGQTALIIAISTSKTSVALFLLRIVVKTWHKIVLWAVIASLAIICFLCAALNFLQCDPVAHLWNPTIEAKCWMSITPLAIATGSYSVFVDFLLAGLPWAIVWTLNMRKKEKLNIAVSLSLGVFAGMCGIIRTYELQGLSSRSDYSYDTVSLVLWSASELLITMMCANIPMMRPLWAKLLGRSTGYGGESPGPNSNNMMRGRGTDNPTIRSGRHSQKRSKDLGKKMNAWNELQDVDSTSISAAGGFVNKLGGPKQGKNRTVVKGSFLDDDARSSESILRDDRQRMGSGGEGRIRGIEVSKQYTVTGDSVSGVGRAW